MNIDGFGEKQIQLLIEHKLIDQVDDIYSLNYAALIDLPRMGEKSVNSLLKYIEKSKIASMDRFLYALGIPQVGRATSKTLASRYPSMKGLEVSTPSDLEELDDIGPIVAKKICDYFGDIRNQQLIRRLFSKGVSIEPEQYRQSDFLGGMTFVITGRLLHYSRNDLQDILEHLGAKVSSTISKQITALIVGEEPGSKLEKANKQHIPLINEDQIVKVIREGDVNEIIPLIHRTN